MQDKLRQLQLVELSILKAIDSFCQKHNLKYSLYVGTLLGAIRHHGFIPWDDDVDICMPRNDYVRFVKLWPKDGPKGYILQNKENTPTFSQSFTKVRKDHTTFLTKSDLGMDYHTGIFVDIFPIDRIPNGKLSRLLFTYRCLKYQLLTREFIPPKGSLVEKVVSFVLLKCYPMKRRKQARERLLKKITYYNNNHQYSMIATEIALTIRQPLPASLFDHMIRLPFEDGEFMCTKDWDKYLCIRYGDYMTLPPESERTWKHQPEIIDFEKNSDELNYRNEGNK